MGRGRQRASDTGSRGAWPRTSQSITTAPARVVTPTTHHSPEAPDDAELPKPRNSSRPRTRSDAGAKTAAASSLRVPHRSMAHRDSARCPPAPGGDVAGAAD